MRDDTEAAIGKMMDVLPLINRTLFAVVRQIGHPAHYTLLSTLAHRPGTVSELAERLGVSLPSMSTMLGTLEARGWVRRSAGKSDRRVVQIELTAAGAEVLGEMRAAIAACLRERLADLPPEDAAMLLAGLDVLRAVFQPGDATANASE
ncbi:MAG TPA: MarR family transcriptional regulator [Aggregatilineales bacterium]|nr:MarR family transcriptional regulator [Chloroflexota bacterium]HOA24943.1 MarR family transcriptional regulator [Aggregatilineales bacterium]HQA69784.1 MarR family transcriptional regulator [Aggregatilineales bacterium]HQE19969.1 MarR family transcriptional regulator [Aggregatilineales bacterium]